QLAELGEGVRPLGAWPPLQLRLAPAARTQGFVSSPLPGERCSGDIVMAFWLARERRGQDFDYIQRFDPRFWTVDFPRPMMASVTTTAPDALRVELEFHHADALAGLIWESADRFDHPLLSYATDRNYPRTTLR